MSGHSHTVREVEDQIDALAAECYRVAGEHGWWEEERTFGEVIALMHSELSEALEEYRDGRSKMEIHYVESQTDYGAVTMKPEGIAVELADVLIRIFDFCGRYNVPLGRALVEKMAYNESRPYRHGGKVM